MERKEFIAPTGSRLFKGEVAENKGSLIQELALNGAISAVWDLKEGERLGLIGELAVNGSGKTLDEIKAIVAERKARREE